MQKQFKMKLIIVLTIITLGLIHDSKSSSSQQLKRIPLAYHYSPNKERRESLFNQWARESISKGQAEFKDVEPVVDPNSNADTNNQRSIYVAKEFLNNASPEFMSCSSVSCDEDRLVEVGRSIADLVELNQKNEELLQLDLTNVVEQCNILANGDLKLPTIRFGKTEIQMPIATLGCMRFQQAWGNRINTMDQVDPKVQENLKDILKYAITRLGMNHIETAKGYGCSELQIGQALQDLYKENITKREDLIIQSKINPMKPKDFRKALDTTLELLQTDYLDLFSFHGLNMDFQFDLVFNNPDGAENLMDIVREYQREGKIKHVGFSTHAQPELIRKFIDTDQFEYANLHYHYFGSYTASGGGKYGGNLENIRLMKQKDMGVFVISAYDKGGRLYAPSKKLRSLTLPELEPIQFGSLWLWAHEEMDEENATIHTFTVGAARPSDLDETAVAAYLFKNNKQEVMKKVKTVVKKLDDTLVAVLGKDWVKTWHEGLPNCQTENDVYQFGQIVSLYNLIKAFGMLDYAKDRYGTFDGNLKNWNSELSNKENIAKRRVGWGYMPGITPKPGTDYSDMLSEVPEKNKDKVLEALDFTFKFCSNLSGACPDIPREWETAFDMSPWCAFPERK